MTIRSILSLVLFLLFVIVNSCEYQTDEVYFREIDKNVAQPDLTIDLNLSADTMYVYSQPTIKLKIKLTNKSLFDVKLFANDVEVQKYTYDPENYVFSFTFTDKPIVKVKAKIYTSTGTGSIADKLQAEAFIFETREWVLIQCKDVPVIKSEIADGRLKLSWTPVKGSSSVKYYISTSSSGLDSTYNTWYIDSLFTGGTNYVYVHYEDSEVSGYSASAEFNYPYPEAILANRDSFCVKWEKCKFYNNIKGYRVDLNDSIVDIPNPDATAFVIKKGRFNNLYSMSIGLLPRKDKGQPITYFASVLGWYQLDFLPHSTIKYYPCMGDEFYYWSMFTHALMKFSIVDKTEVSDSVFIPGISYFTVSANNKYILYDQSSNLQLIDNQHMEIIKSVPISDIGASSFFGLTISDNAKSVFYDYIKSSIIVYDFLNAAITDEIPVISYLQQFAISPDGSYLYVPKLNTLYKTESGSHSTIWGDENTPFQYSFYEFLPNTAQIALYDGKVFYIKNCIDFSTDRSFTLNNAELLDVDYNRNQILTYENFAYNIYSLVNGNLLKTIPGSLGYDTHLFNDYLISEHQLNINNP